MKKLTKKQRWYLLRRYHKLNKLYKKKGNKNISTKNKDKTKPLRINAPAHFSLVSNENRASLLYFLNKIEEKVKNKQKVIILFNNTVLLEPDGTLLFVAKIEQLLTLNPGYISCKYPNNEVVEQLFQHIGLFSKLGLSPRSKITAENVKHWHYTNGNSTDTTEFKKLFKTYACKLDEEVSESLYDSMAEAVTNCIMHAYDENVISKNNLLNKIQKKEWWMFAQYKDNKLTVVILDLGIGIPSSLQQKPEIKEFILSSISALRKRKDTELIEIAVQSSRSRTKLKHRGLGLPEMLECVKAGNVGRFLVLSGKGIFYYDAKVNFESSLKKDYEERIPGTLIQWEIEIPLNNDCCDEY